MPDIALPAPFYFPSAATAGGDNRLSILYVCHEGALYGSQQSLKLMLMNLDPAHAKAFVSLARPGPLEAQLAELPNVSVLSHRRLQWVKHDRRSWLQRFGDFFQLLALTLPRAWSLARHILEHDIHVVHTNSVVSLEGPLAAWITGVPHVWHIRELFMLENPKLNMVLGRTLSRWIIHILSSRVVCISQSVRNQFGRLATRNPEKYLVIYNALPCLPESLQVQPPANELEEKEKVFRIGYLGRLSTGKRFQDLLAAVAQLKAQGVPVKLQVAGDFVDEAFKTQVQGLLRQYHLVGKVRFLGYQPEPETTLYPNIDVLVLPSLNEPFGRVLIEAMAAGIPCIGARSGGVPEIIEDGVTGFLSPPQDVDALAALLLSLSEDPTKLHLTVGEAGRRVRERFNIEAQTHALAALYQDVLLPTPNPVSGSLNVPLFRTERATQSTGSA